MLECVRVCRGILLGRFLEPVDGPQDPYAYVAHIMTNVTRIQKGRDIVLEPGRGFLQALVSQIQSPSAIRRQGCSAAFRNLCFGAQVLKAASSFGQRT